MRAEADQFLGSDLPLFRYPRLYLVLLEYSLAPIVERRIEAARATIKAFGRNSFGVGVPCVCASIRCNSNLELVMQNPDFMAYACAQWRSRSLWGQALRMRYTTDEYVKKSVNQKCMMIYQAGLDQEYQDTTESRTEMNLFKIATLDTRVPKPKPVDTV